MPGFLLLVLVVAIGLGVFFLVRSSLPKLDGTHLSPELSAPVRLERDVAGVVTVRGKHRPDLGYTLGFAHAQDRRFQMDLYRRLSAGELSALLGRAGIESDRKLRVHRFRCVAREVLASLSSDEREFLELYAAGVNAGTAQLKVRPFEYLLLRTSPQPWLAEDSVLVNLSMFVMLQNPQAMNKVQRGLIESALPKAVADFIYGEAPKWEAAIDGSITAPPTVPDQSTYDLKLRKGSDFSPPKNQLLSLNMRGSNGFAISGKRSATGAALVANDMHLGLSVPNIWYRARLLVKDEAKTSLDVTGVTLPGAPVVLAGSNGQIAWGLTNSFADFQEVVIGVTDPANPNFYLTPDGPKPFVSITETIIVKGAKPVDMKVVSTQWGPVIGKDANGRMLSLAWTAHNSKASHMGMHKLETATTVSEALTIAAGGGTPGINFIVGDAAGHIGWTVMGKIPKWKGNSHQVPKLSTDPFAGFDGLVAPENHPRIERGGNGYIVNANNRSIGADWLTMLGDGGFDLGVRAFRIAEEITKRGDKLTEDDMLAIQLDDTAALLTCWHKRLVALLDNDAVAKNTRRREMREVLRSWSGRAAVDDAAYPLVRAFRLEMVQRAFFALIAPARAQSPQFEFIAPASFEGPLTLLLEQEPEHLLPHGIESWRDFQLSAVDAVLKGCGTGKLASRTWGRINNVRIRHPLSAALPGLSWLLDMPVQAIPGDNFMPRMNCPEVGVSERFAVSPGREEEGYFTMPGGQSGHPLSPFYRAGHSAWVQGEKRPFLPGHALHVLELKPRY